VNLAAIAASACALGASQMEMELAAVLTLIAAHSPQGKPSVVVEIGCDRGATLYAWRALGATVYGITLAENGYSTGGSNRPLVAHGATVRVGDSHDPESVDWLVRKLGVLGQIDALVLDGDHSAAGVRQDLAMYGPLVRPGGLILIHDIAPTSDLRVEVPAVWREISPRYKTREVRCAPAGFGWGVIHVRADDKFDQTERADNGQEASADGDANRVRRGRVNGAARGRRHPGGRRRG
jgi:predicted O-methyltransferase YrrM